MTALKIAEVREILQILGNSASSRFKDVLLTAMNVNLQQIGFDGNITVDNVRGYVDGIHQRQQDADAFVEDLMGLPAIDGPVQLTHEERVARRPPAPVFRAPTPYIQTQEYIKAQQERELRKHVLQKRLDELQQEQTVIKRRIEELETKKQQERVKQVADRTQALFEELIAQDEHQSVIKPSLLQQIPVVANTFHTPGIPETVNDYDNIAAVYLGEEPAPNPNPKDYFNPASYAEFRRFRTAQFKHTESALLRQRFDELDAHPFDHNVDLSDIHNRELITPLFKEFMLKHIAQRGVKDKIQFRYHCAGSWHSVKLSSVFTQLMTDLDTVGFDIHENTEFEGSDVQGDVKVNIGIIDGFVFHLTQPLKAKKEGKRKVKRGKQGAFFNYVLKPEFATDLMKSQLERCQIYDDVSKAPKDFDNCFIYALILQNAGENTTSELKTAIKTHEVKDMEINAIAKKFRLCVQVADIEDGRDPEHRSYGLKAADANKTYKLVRYRNHYFINELTQFTKYYIENILE
jgi:hypothetical protein